jgi:hypothetical protein
MFRATTVDHFTIGGSIAGKTNAKGLQFFEDVLAKRLSFMGFVQSFCEFGYGRK